MQQNYISYSNRLELPDEPERGGPGDEVVLLEAHNVGGKPRIRDLGEIDLLPEQDECEGRRSSQGESAGIPDEERKVIDIRVRVEDVSDGMVRVVAVLPPVAREAERWGKKVTPSRKKRGERREGEM